MSRQTPNRIGKGMFICGWIIGIIGLTWFFQQQADKQNNPNQNITGSISPAGAKQIVLKRNRHNQYILSGFINKQPVKFLLDTGATEVSIPEKTAQRLNLEKGFASKAITANGTVTVYQTKLTTLSIGNIKLYNLRAHINPGSGRVQTSQQVQQSGFA